jgi:hypothetical protein
MSEPNLACICVPANRARRWLMLDAKDRIRERYRDEIHRKQRQANALTIEVTLEAETATDVITLAETALALDAAIDVLDEAKSRLKTSSALTPIR